MPLKYAGLTAFKNSLDKEIDLATFETAHDVMSIVHDLSPVDEGDLQSTARIEPSEANGGAEYAVESGGISGPNKFVNYAGIVEADQPFFAPAVRAIDRLFRYRQRIAALAARSKV